MHGVFEAAPRPSNRGAAEFSSEKFRALRRKKFFRIVAKHAFPKKTVPSLVALTGYSERAIYAWLAGDTEPPSGVLLRLFGEISAE